VRDACAVKITGLHMVVLLLLQTLWVQASHSEPPRSPIFSEEDSKQTAIYQSRGEDVPQGYVIDRSLLSYTYVLSSEFRRSLADLGPEDRWLDIGAGEGRATLDYCTAKYDGMLLQGRERRGKKAKAIAISIEDRRTVQWQRTAASLEANQIQYLFGRPLREYSLEELGQFQVITDVAGGFSYTRNLSLFMEKALGFLALNGSFYTLLQDVRSENGTNRPYYPDARFLTEIADADGSEVRICSWLKSVTCVEVTCELKPEWSPPIEVYRIRKVCDNVTIPDLVATHFEAGTPPERRFQLGNPSPASPGRTSTTP
jgi:hypothetical protein